MEPLKSTLAELTAAKLYQWAKDNAPKPPIIQQVALDPANSAAYIKFQALREGVREVYGGEDIDPIYGDNPHTIDQFGHDANEWENHGKSSGAPPPPFPQLKRVDLDQFEKWWGFYNLRFDPTSPFHDSDEYTTMIQHTQFYKVPADPYPAFVPLPPTVTTPLPATGNPIGRQISAFPPLFAQATTGHNVGDSEKNATGTYVLINPSPMLNDPAKFEWLKVG